MSRKVDVDSLKLFENTSRFNKDFIENCNDDSDSDDVCFLEIDASISRLIA